MSVRTYWEIITRHDASEEWTNEGIEACPGSNRFDTEERGRRRQARHRRTRVRPVRRGGGKPGRARSKQTGQVAQYPLQEQEQEHEHENTARGNVRAEG